MYTCTAFTIVKLWKILRDPRTFWLVSQIQKPLFFDQIFCIAPTLTLLQL